MCALPVEEEAKANLVPFASTAGRRRYHGSAIPALGGASSGGLVAVYHELTTRTVDVLPKLPAKGAADAKAFSQDLLKV